MGGGGINNLEKGNPQGNILVVKSVAAVIYMYIELYKPKRSHQ